MAAEDAARAAAEAEAAEAVFLQWLVGEWARDRAASRGGEGEAA